MGHGYWTWEWSKQICMQIKSILISKLTINIKLGPSPGRTESGELGRSSPPLNLENHLISMINLSNSLLHCSSHHFEYKITDHQSIVSVASFCKSLRPSSIDSFVSHLFVVSKWRPFLKRGKPNNMLTFDKSINLFAKKHIFNSDYEKNHVEFVFKIVPEKKKPLKISEWKKMLKRSKFLNDWLSHFFWTIVSGIH